ncbi:AMP-binding protein [Streptomyces sp. NPDC051662]|uniref:class I adenylate-forming enzyme family protein n=1 Tax=Streptomyces sp. NPDC051662 TaxID=3154750 RepID=UPI00342E90D5
MTGGSIHQLFEEWARRVPDHTAAITDSDRISYERLDADAGRLAAYLSTDAGLPDSGATVAICTRHPAEVLVSILAVLKAGHAYAVLNPSTPTQEQHRLLGLTRAEAIITNESLLPRVDDGRDRTAICLDTDATAIAHAGPAPRDSADPAPGGPAAVLFTAGTTGRHVAVATGHDRLLAAYAAWSEVYGMSPEDRVLVTAPPSTTEFTGGWIRALCSGATLVLPERPITAEWITTEQITVAEMSPATAARVLDMELPSLRLLAVSGAPLRLDEQLRLQALLPATGARVLSVYGTAEVAGCGTWFEPEQLPGPVANPERAAYLGLPFPGCAAELRKGRIWLTPPEGGDAVPTDDVGRRQGEGPMEFRGRTADQVTIDGRTVDTYRVETALAGHPHIQDVVITGDRGRTGSRLIAFVVPSPRAPFGAAPEVASLRGRLTGLVPAGDVPEAVVRLRKLPTNAAGKVNREKLPLPPIPGAVRASGKSGSGEDTTEGAIAALVGVTAGFIAAVLTGVIFPGATDVSGVPAPWNGLFMLLYLAEWLAFAVGMGFLAVGRGVMLRRSESRGLTTAAHLAIVYLLVAWWPQDNLYRLTAKTDWPRQAALVWAFNVPLMIAAFIVMIWVVASLPAVRKQNK